MFQSGGGLAEGAQVEIRVRSGWVEDEVEFMLAQISFFFYYIGIGQSGRIRYCSRRIQRLALIAAPCR